MYMVDVENNHVCYWSKFVYKILFSNDKNKRTEPYYIQIRWRINDKW